MRYFDGFLFSDEWAMLRLRCEELKGLNVTHILVESPWTHSGLPKPLHFQERKEEFKQYNIKHVIATDIIVPGRNARYAETLQRNAIAWELVGCSDEDVIIISDVDEVPRKTEVEKYRSEMGLAALSMDNFYFWLNSLTDYDNWRMPKIMNYGFLKHNTPDQVRDMGYPTTLHNAGWHFSWIGGVEKVMDKFRNFSHQEEDVQRRAVPEELKRKINNAESMWGEGKYWVIPIGESYPEYLRNNVKEFEHLIKDL